MGSEVGPNNGQQKRQERIMELIAEIAELDDPGAIRPTDRLREDLGMDSLKSLELLSTVSEEFRLDLEMEAAMGITTLQDAFDFIERNWSEQKADESSGN
jgi:acyl carrier protein